MSFRLRRKPVPRPTKDKAEDRVEAETLYPTLDTRTLTIRLITLLPGAWSEPITCSLTETKLSAQQPYKALSYAWNNGYATSDVILISVNGRAIPVGHNLYTALRRLRRPQTSVQVWVDSLCINQDDVSERTQQVKLMRDIYQNSSEVVIWLGEKGINDDLGDSILPIITGQRLSRTPEDDLARVEWYGDDRDLPKLNAYIQSVSKRDSSFNPNIRDIFGGFCVLYLLSMKIPAAEIMHLRHIDYSMPIVKGLYAIMDQSWWRRIWVVQETVVARKATIYYSRFSAPWSMFSDAAIEYDRTHLLGNVNSVYPYLHDGQPLMHFSRIVTEIETTRRLWLNIQPTSLLPLLRKFRARQATDQRDKVFALLGLVSHWLRGPRVVPDYRLEARQVFWDTTTTLIQANGSLSILAGTLQQNSMQWDLNPSWVADWGSLPELHENVRVGNLPLYDAARGLSGTVRVHRPSVLETTGCQVDEIIFVGQELPLSTERQSSRLRLVVSQWEKTLDQLGTAEYVGGGTVADAFWRLLCGDTEYCKDVGGEFKEEKIEFRRAGTSTYSTYLQWRWVDHSANRRTTIIGGYWKESGHEEGAKDENAFHHAVECASGFRRIFITRKGYIGTGPGHIRVGDGVFILYGSRVPFVLRPAGRAATCTMVVVNELFGPEEDKKTFIDLKKGKGDRPEPKKLSTTCNDIHEGVYHVVGDAYVQGMMDGEAMKGEQGDEVSPQSIFLV
ncbi:Hypothetical protein NCS54_01390900 [Fusarium falciforme]|uniref:Hypothetical protein n=1 Tax=Fusarium falciforme TaxID=195108 RepID=UPI0023010647|nr:Hypothetical protein NCS54_01390900 [Fusarium falciforme]WAO96241.1 Hypothetical protein NCS54_01390900 [Fusarium falciforme]